MLETRTDAGAPISARSVGWWLAIVVALVVADVILVICLVFWVLPALWGMSDSGYIFSCHDTACVREGYIVGLITYAGAFIVFAMVIPRIAPSTRDLRWGATLAYIATGLGLLGTAVSRAQTHWAFVFLAIATACLLVLAIGCHVRLRRLGEAMFAGPGSTTR